MTNELIFFAQTIIVSGFVLAALRLGREALVAGISLLFVLANLFVAKQITLFGFAVTAADVYIIGAVLGFNLLQEYFGLAIAHKTIWISFFVSFAVVIMSQLHLLYLPNAYDVTQGAFAQILTLLPRVVAASFAAHIVSQYVRLFLYERLQRVANHGTHKFLFARNVSVTVVEQTVDTALFGFLGLYGVVHAITDVFVVSFGIKLLTILLMSPVVLLIKKRAR